MIEQSKKRLSWKSSPWSLVYFLAYAINFSALLLTRYSRMVADSSIYKEELHSAFRNVLCLDYGVQAHPSENNFAHTIVLWFASHILPPRIEYFAAVKIVLASFGGVAIVALLRHFRPTLHWVSALLAVVLYSTCPPLNWLTAEVTPSGLEVVYGLPLLLIADTLTKRPGPLARHPLFLLLMVLCAFVVHLYPGIYPVLAVIVCLFFVRSCQIRPTEGWTASSVLKRFGSFVGTLLLVILLSLWPLALYQTRPLSMFTSGGLMGSAAELLKLFSYDTVHQSFLKHLNDYFFISDSYSYSVFDDIAFPAFSLRRAGALVLLLSIYGLLSSFRERVGKILLATIVFSILLLWITVWHPNPGIRQSIVLAAVVCMLAAIGVDSLLRSPYGGRTVILSLCCVGFGVASLYESLGIFAARRGVSTVSYERPVTMKTYTEEAGLRKLRPDEIHIPPPLGQLPKSPYSSSDLTKITFDPYSTRNIAIVMLGELRPDLTIDLPVDSSPTPFLASLAQDSIRFQNTYSAHLSPWNSTKFAEALLCGRYAFPRPVESLETVDTYAPSDCLGALFQRSAYKVIDVRGYPAWFPPNETFLRNTGFTDVLSPERTNEIVRTDIERLRKKDSWYYEDAAVVKLSEAWLKENSNKPFVAVYQTITSRFSFPSTPGSYTANFPGRVNSNHSQSSVVEKEYNDYLDSLGYLDQTVAALMKQYKDLGLLDRTVFVFIGGLGKGFGSNSHGREPAERYLWQDGIRVPFFIVDPSGQFPARSVEHPTSQVDVLPTILGLLGNSTIQGLQGRDALSTGTSPNSRSVISFCHSHSVCAAIISGNTKLITNLDGSHQKLFDLKSDPGELAARSAGETGEQSSLYDSFRSTYLQTLIQATPGIVQLPNVRNSFFAQEPAKHSLPQLAKLGPGIELAGFQISKHAARPGDTIRVDLLLRKTAEVPNGWRVSLKYGELEKNLSAFIWQEAVMPIDLWPIAAVRHVTTTFQAPTAAAPIRLDLWLGLEREEGGFAEAESPLFTTSKLGVKIGSLLLLQEVSLVAFGLIGMFAIGALVAHFVGRRGNRKTSCLVYVTAALLMISTTVTFGENINFIRSYYRSWLILDYPDKEAIDFATTASRIESQLQQSALPVTLREMSPDYFAMFELICKREKKHCYPIQTQRFNDYHLQDCLKNVEYGPEMPS